MFYIVISIIIILHTQYKCLKPCESINKKCSVNHKCQRMCCEDCSSCIVKVEKTLPCGHVKNDIPCGLNCDEILCNHPCIRTLKCNHKCQSRCYEPCKPCENLVS